MSWTRIGIINLLIFFVLLVFAEVVLRSAWTVRSCFKSNCDLGRITALKVYDVQSLASKFIGITRFDDHLGYVPREGFDAVIKASGWTNDAKVTITNDGFRLNNVEKESHIAEVLVVGDSFTFGDQVSNHETWPACLEKKLNRGVDNGGVFGYGAAQALKRASLKLSEKNYSSLVLSVVVGSDFERDRLSYRSGFAKPALVRIDDSIGWSAVSDPNQRGTKYNPSNPSKQKRLVAYLYERSLLLAFVVYGLIPQIDFSGDGLTKEHPNAADKDAIIEWTLKEFSHLKIDKKILLLQYGENLTDLKVLTERKKLLEIASALSLKVVDTMNVLTQYEPLKLWARHSGHHTPYGNEVVCEYLFERGFRRP
jgi:hypothetical protein